MSSLEASSGWRLRAEGIPARKEWQVMVLVVGEQMSVSSEASILFNREGVRFFPEANRNTGDDRLCNLESIWALCRACRLATGQQL
jgi:hypothetical protein